MKANAPEKIYLSAIDLEEVGHLLTESNDRDDVEYTRTDTFIEKACGWLKENADMYEAFDSESESYYMDKDKLVEDFKKYMEE